MPPSRQFVSEISEQKWRSRRTIPHTISRTRLTGMESRNLRGIVTAPPKGQWRTEMEYVNYKSERIVVAESISYLRLISSIAAELNIDEARKNIDVRYVVDDNEIPFHIRNDNGVRLYVKLKKAQSAFVMYPLCISMIDKSSDDIQFDR